MSLSIGLATVTNKTNTLFAQNLPHMVGKGIDECFVINHCSEKEILDHELSFDPSSYGNTLVCVENFSGKFHEARNLSFERLQSDVKVVWNDDHVFTQNDGSMKFKERIENAYDRFGEGNYVFVMPTFALHPRLLTKAKPFTGMSGDAAICVGAASGIDFCEDEKYADRQKHTHKIKAFIGACGVFHLDQIKAFEFLAYRGLLNSKMRNFNLENESMEEAWLSRMGQPISHTVGRLAKKMNDDPNAYFLRAPDSYVEQLPKALRDLADLSVSEFREAMFGETTKFTFEIKDVDAFEPSRYIAQHWLHSDF